MDSHRLSKVAIGAALIVGAAVVVLPVSLLAQPLVLQRARFLVPLVAQSPVPFSFLPFFLSADILHFRLCLFKQNLKIRLHAHLDAASKQKSAETMEEFLKLV